MSVTMESITASSTFAWVTSLFKKEIEHFIVLIVTAYIGWWLFHHLGGGVFGCFSAQKKPKKQKKNANCSEADIEPDGELFNAGADGSESPQVCESTDSSGLLISCSAPSLATPPGFLQSNSNGEAVSRTERSPNALLEVEQQPTVRPVKEIKAAKRKKTTPDKDQPEGAERELGRVVCWRDNGFGFIVDEEANRLFVRQTEVEGEEKLMPGQLVWFRRGKTQSNQATKALDVALVDVEVAKILRRAEKDGIPWSKLRTAINSGDESVLAKFKALASSSAEACPSTTKTPALVNRQAQDAPKMVTPAPEKNVGSNATDADLQAFLGTGSVNEMRKNLKYAPQWVKDEFVARHGE